MFILSAPRSRLRCCENAVNTIPFQGAGVAAESLSAKISVVCSRFNALKFSRLTK
jgi:hypothetical protein